jgi:hypothetical protein
MAGNYLQSLMGEREQVILTTRHHWFILVSSIVLEIFIILIIFTLTLWGSIAATQPPFVWRALILHHVDPMVTVRDAQLDQSLIIITNCW